MGSDDISLEPLFNDGKSGEGAKITAIAEIGKATHRASAAVTASAEEITITAGQNSIEIHNSGSNIIYYGGTGVTNNTGIPIYPNSTKIFVKVKRTFSVFIVCAAGETSTRRIVEYE